MYAVLYGVTRSPAILDTPAVAPPLKKFPELYYDMITMSVARKQLGKNICETTDTHALEAVLSMWSVLRLYSEDG